MKADLLIHGTGQFLTLASKGPKVGPDMSVLGRMEIVVKAGRPVWPPEGQ